MVGNGVFWLMLRILSSREGSNSGVRVRGESCGAQVFRHAISRSFAEKSLLLPISLRNPTSIILQSQQHPCYRIVAVFSSDHIESGSAVRVVADADAVVDAGLCICSIGLDQLKSGN